MMETKTISVLARIVTLVGLKSHMIPQTCDFCQNGIIAQIDFLAQYNSGYKIYFLEMFGCVKVFSKVGAEILNLHCLPPQTH